MTDNINLPSSQGSQSFEDLLNYLDTPYLVTGVNQSPNLAPTVNQLDLNQHVETDFGHLNHQPCNHAFENDGTVAKREREPSTEHLSTDSGFPQSIFLDSNYNNHDELTTAILSDNVSPHIHDVMKLEHPHAAAPSISDHPGPYEFIISFGEKTESAVKNANYTHSIETKKLYVKMNVPCPIQFHCEKEIPPNVRIRAMMVYAKPENSSYVVARCPSHRYHCTSAIVEQNQHLSRHVIQISIPANTQDNTSYETDPISGRDSVLIPFYNPVVGERYFTVLYKFMCLSSCVGGINRRPVMGVFTMQDSNGNLLGRRCVEVKICSSPGRDRKQDENRRRKSLSNAVPIPKKKSRMGEVEPPSVMKDGEEYFFLKVRGKENYKLLSDINEALNLASMVTEEQKEEYNKRKNKDKTDIAGMVRSFFQRNT